MSDNEKVINDLAKQFALDYYSISSVLSATDKEITCAKEVFQEKFFNEFFESKSSSNNINRKVRNVFVLGAGASYDCFKEILLANDAIDKIKEKLDIELLFGNKYFKEKINEEKEKIEKLYRLNPNDFESQLAILSNYIKIDDIRGQLANIYDKRYYPSLFYEILAHLFKHRFIDVIINFNFDELLDIAIQEELNNDDFHYIFSDGQCQPLNDLLVNDRLKLPLYIKPHGTISHQSSMKFTKNDYFGLSSSMKKQLSEIIAGKIGGENCLERVNLIVAGFGMKSFEFNQIMRGLPQNSAIYYFSPDEPDLEYFMKDDIHFGQKITKFSKFDNGELRWIQLQKDKNDHNQLGNILKKLYNDNLRKRIFKPTYEPKDIYRHELISEFFYDSVRGKRITDIGEDHENNEKGYFEARMYVEFVIAICKSKGRIRLVELLQERFGFYYDLYFKKSRKTGTPLSLEEIIEKFGIGKFYDKSDNLILLPNRNLSDEMIEMLLTFLHERIKLGQHFEGIKKLLEKNEKRNILKMYLKKIYEHDTNSISPKFQDKNLYLYRGVEERNIISTKLSLLSNLIMKDVHKWDLILVSSQKGKILLNLLISELREKKDSVNSEKPFMLYDRKTCCLIVEDDLYSDTIKEHLKEERLIDGKINISKNLAKNNNVILFLIRNEKSSNGWQILKGIVYQKLNDSNKISPILTYDSSDLTKLTIDFFENYFDNFQKNQWESKLLEFAKNFDHKMANLPPKSIDFRNSR